MTRNQTNPTSITPAGAADQRIFIRICALAIFSLWECCSRIVNGASSFLLRVLSLHYARIGIVRAAPLPAVE
jgi:hypothetical protein